MATLLIWKTSQFNRSETRVTVRDLDDLIDLVRSEFSERMIFLEAREGDGSGPAKESHVRVAADDLTDDDFHWLTAPVKNEVRGVRA